MIADADRRSTPIVSSVQHSHPPRQTWSLLRRVRQASMPTAKATCRRMAVSCSAVTREGVAVRRCLEVVATRCEAAQHGLAQPFSVVGAMATDRSGITRAASSVSGYIMSLG